MIFDAEKFERIKNAKEDARQSYEAANDNWRFQRDELARLHQMFEKDFNDFKIFRDIDGEFTAIRKMPADNFPARQAATQTLLAKVPTDAQIYRHLKQLIEHLLSTKRAEARQIAAAENQSNHGRCFAVLEAFARKHISLKMKSWDASESTGNAGDGFDNTSYPMA